MYKYVLYIYIYKYTIFTYNTIHCIHAFVCNSPSFSDLLGAPGKLQEKVKILEKESLQKDEALDDAQHQLQERGRGKIVVHYGGLIWFNDV